MLYSKHWSGNGLGTGRLRFVKAMALVGGYENELVEPSADLQCECSICLQIVREPCMVSCCSLRFCRSCIEQIQDQLNPCPHCQRKRFTILSDTQLKRLLMHKRVYCINKNAGCQWVGELKEAEKHVRVDCMWTEVACPNQCGQRALPRCKLNQHATEECPRHPRQCDFAGMGCDSEALTPDGLQDHMQWSVQEHLTLVCKKLKEAEFQEALKMSKSEVMILARDAKIRELETAVQAHETNPMVGELEAVAQVHEARVGELEAAVRTREAKIAELEATVQAREARELEARVVAQQAEMKELEARVHDRVARIRHMEISAQVHNERIKELESTAEAQQTKILELNTTIRVRNARIKKLSASVQTYKTKLGELEALLQDQDNQKRILKTAVDASETKIGELEAILQAREAIMDLQLQVHNTEIRYLEATAEAKYKQLFQARDTKLVQGLKARVQEVEAKIRNCNLTVFLLGAALLATVFALIYVVSISKVGALTYNETEWQQVNEL